jgi:uncharacterized membrane protein
VFGAFGLPFACSVVDKNDYSFVEDTSAGSGSTGTGTGTGAGGGSGGGATSSCADSPCLNDGTCTDTAEGYECDCPTGFTGAQCATLEGGCDPNPCENGGSCVESGDGFSCDCPGGFSGELCERPVDGCEDDPCLFGGTCTDLDDGYECDCPTGLTGTNCGTNVDECDGNACQNGAMCVDDLGAYTCECLPGYSGDLCETNIDECTPDPCQNGGTCTDGIDAFSCECTLNWGGATCDTVLFEGLGFLPDYDEFGLAEDVSGDGLVVVGWTRAASTLRPFKWTAEAGMTELQLFSSGSHTARGTNHDGTLIVGGLTNSSDVQQGAHWTTGGLANLQGTMATWSAAALATSDDGSVVVGTCATNNDYSRACRWVDNNFQSELLTPPQFYETSYAWDVSADGSVIAGYTSDPSSAFRWTEANGWEPLIGLNGEVEVTARVVSRDGSTIYGFSEGEAVRWVGDEPVEGLGFGFDPADASADGSVVVGNPIVVPTIWDAENGERTLAAALTALGADLSGWTLGPVSAISDDGTVIVGRGTHDGLDEPFVARIP